MLKLMKTLYDCGAITNNEVEKLGINESILNDLISKEQIATKMQKGEACYMLTEFGEKVYRLNTNRKLFFRCINLEKCTSLAAFYASLTDEERNTWKNKDAWYAEGYVGAIPDATYLNDGKMYGVYVVTDSTSQNTIKKIEEFVAERNISQMNYLK